jgi:hypothetical protein
MSGDQNLCLTVEPTIVGRYGGFADQVRAHAEWVTPLPAGIDPAKAGPLFCAGVTVFNPLIQFDVKSIASSIRNLSVSTLVEMPSTLRLSPPNLNDPLVSSVHKIYIVQCPEIWLRSFSSG